MEKTNVKIYTEDEPEEGYNPPIIISLSNGNSLIFQPSDGQFHDYLLSLITNG